MSSSATPDSGTLVRHLGTSSGSIEWRASTVTGLIAARPTESAAVPEMVGVVSFVRALFVGAVIATVGFAVSTVNVRAGVVVALPAASVAVAVTV